jgi:hypothetical protein
MLPLRSVDRVARFLQAGSARYDLGQPSWLTSSLGTFTWLLLIRWNGTASLRAGDRIVAMDTSGSATYLATNGTAGECRVLINRATTDTNYNTGTNALIAPNGAWTWIAVTVNTGAGNGAKVRFARRVLQPDGAPTVVTATVSNEGSGTVSHQFPLALGSQSNGNATGGPFDVAAFAMWDKAMSAAEIRRLVATPTAELFRIITASPSERLEVSGKIRIAFLPGTEIGTTAPNLQDPAHRIVATGGVAYVPALGAILPRRPTGPWPMPRQPAAGGITAQLSRTLATRTVTGQATVAVAAQVSRTLAARTASAQAQVAVTGQLSRSLADRTLASQAQVAITAQLSRILAASTLASTVSTGGAIQATLDRTLAARTASGQAQVAVTAQVSRSLAARTVSAQAQVAISAQTSRTLAARAALAQAQVAVAGQLSRMLAARTAASQTQVAIAAQGALTTAKLAASSATVLVQGALLRTISRSLLALAGSGITQSLGSVEASGPALWSRALSASLVGDASGEASGSVMRSQSASGPVLDTAGESGPRYGTA